MEDLRSDLAAFPIRADDGHDPRLEEGLHRRRRGGPRPCGGLVGESGRDRERQDHVADAAIDRRGHPKTGRAKDVEHPAVVAQHIRVERVDAVFPRDAREALQQAHADAVALQGIGDGECHLCAVGRFGIRVEAREGHEPPSGLGDERGRRAIGAGGDLPDTLGVESRQPQKAEIPALRRKVLEKPEQCLDVAFLCRSETDGGPVSQDHIGRGCIRHRASARRDARSTINARSGRTSRCGSGSGHGSVRASPRPASGFRRCAAAPGPAGFAPAARDPRPWPAARNRCRPSRPS